MLFINQKLIAIKPEVNIFSDTSTEASIVLCLDGKPNWFCFKKTRNVQEQCAAVVQINYSRQLKARQVDGY